VSRATESGGGRWASRPTVPMGLRGAASVLVVVLVVLIAWQRPNPFAHPQTVRVQLRDASGLKKGSEVRVAGTDAGKVTGVKREGGVTVATLELHGDVGKVRRDASAAVWPRLIFEGGAYVELRTGSADEPELGDAPIALARTSSYVPLDRVLRIADAPTRGSVRRIAKGFDAASDRTTTRAVNGTLRAAPELLADVSKTSRAVGGNALRRAVRGMAKTGDAIADHDADLVPVLRDASRTADALHADDGVPLRAALRDLPGTLAAVRTGSADANRTLQTIDAFTTNLRPGLRDVAPTVAVARPVIRRAGTVASSAVPLTASLRAALSRAAQLSPEARALVQEAVPTIDTLDASLLPALQKPTPTLKLPSYVAFLNMFAGGGGASRAFQTPSDNPMQQGDGHFMRFGIRFLTGIGVPVPPCQDVQALGPTLAPLLEKLELCTP
jgi:ABC-type transporter Mla subunit MlaD